MAVRRAHLRPGQLWQVPLLSASLGLFGYAAYLFIDPKPALTLAQQIDSADALVGHDRPEPAIALLNKTLESGKLTNGDEGHIRLLLARALEKGQKLRHLNLESNHQQIIEQTRLAQRLGTPMTADDFRRLGESYESLGKPADALTSYRKSMELDTSHALGVERKVIDLQRSLNDGMATEESLDQYLKTPRITNADRAWALDLKAEVLIKRDAIDEAEALLAEALKLDDDRSAQGVVRYYQGRCARERGDVAEAERLLRAARDLLRTSHPLDAEAAYMLGRIRQEQNDPREAIGFYDAVLIGHPESRPAPLARLGRGQCRIDLNEDDAGIEDLHELVKFVTSRPTRGVYKTEAIAGLKQASAVLVAQGNFQGALELMAAEQTLAPDPAGEFFGRLAAVYERRADQLEQATAGPQTAVARASNSTSAAPIDPAKRGEMVRSLRTQAGDAYVALSHKLTLSDDRASGQALWRGIDLYDRAGALSETIAALERFVGERPEDGQAPDALLRLGRSYQARGQYDEAIAAFLKNQFRYPQSLAASKSGVPLAQAYIAKGSDSYAKAEKVLLAVVENNPVLTPEAEEFRQALFEMAQLYYRTGRYEDAVSRLEELTQRYPNDVQSGQLMFLMADSYRKSAALLDAAKSRPAGDTGAAVLPTFAQNADREEVAIARADRLRKAKTLFDKTIDLFGQNPPKGETDTIDQKLAFFYRADCMFDQGRYEEAIKLYSTATQRYQDDPISLAGYVQIVNAYNALGKPMEARAANERAKWLLRRMPQGAFEKNKMSLPRQYWDDWLKMTGESGLWARG